MVLTLVLLAPLLAAPYACAEGVLSPSAAYSVKKELKEAGQDPGTPENFYTSVEIDFDSRDPNDKSGQPMVSTHTEQLSKLKKLPKLDPKDPATPKDGLDSRQEMTIERLVNVTKAQLPGLGRMFEQRADAGAILASRPLILRGDGHAPKKIDNLASVRGDALAAASDPMTRNTLSLLLDESKLLPMGRADAADSSCLTKLTGKKPGDKWSYSQEAQGVKLDFECTFQGWAEEGGKKIEVVKVHSPKAKAVRNQPNGVPGMTETGSDGMIYGDPALHETASNMVTTVSAEPMPEEIAKLQAKGQTIPRNISTVKNWTHIYAM